MNIDKSDIESEKLFHSSGYAKVANGSSIGSTSGQTFGQRYAADRDRVVVRKYRDSHIGRGALRHQARNGVIDPFARANSPTTSSRQSQNTAESQIGPTTHTVASLPRQSFKEPPTRGFNPFN